MLDTLTEIAREAGNRIMKYFQSPALRPETKADGSPVTPADLASDAWICGALAENFPWPIISEESVMPPFASRRHWPEFFLVDPLDGTKDFLAGGREFTVNIALMRNRTPVLGVVYAPATEEMFSAAQDQGAQRLHQGIREALPLECPSIWTLARSHFHDHPTFDNFARQNRITRHLQMSSAIRLPRLAQGKINLCLCSNRSSEWDIAAGHVLVKETGGRLIELGSGKEPLYNKPEIKNSFLLAHSKDIDLARLQIGLKNP
ncbi:MAG: 3'(2'),5'-bisphosphate nucleotidase CysQ [Nitrospinaceae bacterium]